MNTEKAGADTDAWAGRRRMGKTMRARSAIAFVAGGISSAFQLGATGMSLDWTVDLGSPVFASPSIHDIDNDGEGDILISSLFGKVYVFDEEGNSKVGWPREVALMQRVSPVVGDLDGDGDLEIVVGDTDGKLHAWNASGEYVTGFPIQIEGTIKSTVRLVDLTGGDDLEMVVHTGKSQLHVLDSSGQSLPGWPVDLGGNEDAFGAWTIASTPLIIDLDGNGTMEIAIGTTRNDVQVFNLDGTVFGGWPSTTGGEIYSSLITGDLDADGTPEIIVGGGDGFLYAWSANGSNMPGFPVEVGAPVIATVAIADLNQSGRPELVVADIEGGVYCFTNTGDLLLGWPRQLDSSVVASPLIVDADADDALEIIIASHDNKIHVFELTGGETAYSLLESSDWIESTPLVQDIDRDGTLDLFYAGYDGLLRRINLDTYGYGSAQAWPGFLGESAIGETVSRTGDADRDGLLDTFEMDTFGKLSHTAEGDADGDGFNNLSEWHAGTDPLAASDSFSVSAHFTQVGGQTQLELQWQGKAQRSYRVYSTQAFSSDWELVSGESSLNSTGEQLMTWSTPLASTSDQVYFRVSVVANADS